MRREYVKLALAALLFIALSVSLAVIAIRDSNARTAQEKSFNEALAFQSLRNCEEIEEIKTAERSTAANERTQDKRIAKEDRARLLTNLQLLELEPTEVIVRAADETLARKLRQADIEYLIKREKYAAERCPRRIADVNP